jgi:hypothetical protein
MVEMLFHAAVVSSIHPAQPTVIPSGGRSTGPGSAASASSAGGVLDGVGKDAPSDSASGGQSGVFSFPGSSLPSPSEGIGARITSGSLRSLHSLNPLTLPVEGNEGPNSKADLAPTAAEVSPHHLAPAQAGPCHPAPIKAVAHHSASADDDATTQKAPGTLTTGQISISAGQQPMEAQHTRLSDHLNTAATMVPPSTLLEANPPVVAEACDIHPTPYPVAGLWNRVVTTRMPAGWVGAQAQDAAPPNGKPSTAEVIPLSNLGGEAGTV